MQTKAPAPIESAGQRTENLAQRSVLSVPGVGANTVQTRPEAMALQGLQKITSNSARLKQLKPVQMMAPTIRKSSQQDPAPRPAHPQDATQPSMTSRGNGLPLHLKTGMEDLSGISLDIYDHRPSRTP